MTRSPEENKGRLCLLLALLLSCCGCGADPGGGPLREAEQVPDPSVTYFSGPVPRNIAHRGGRGLFPENTLYAFEHALALDVQILETDAWRTRDGHVVLLHDAEVDRTTDGQGPVTGMTLDQVRALDAAYWFTRDNGETYPLRGQGITIPTLEEAFSRFPNARFCIEIKQASPPIEPDVLRLVEAHGMTEKVCLGSFHDPVLQEVRRLNPDVCTGSSLPEILLFTFLPRDLLDTIPVAADVHQIPEEELGIPVLTPEFLDRARERDMEVHVWTLNDPADMERVLGMGVQGIITDYPDRLNEIIEASRSR